MPPSLVRSRLAPPADALPAGTPLPRDFGQRRPAEGERWPMPLAAAAIVGLSITLWFVLIQAGRMILAVVGQ